MPRTRKESRMRYVQQYEDVRDNIIRFNEEIARRDPRFIKPIAHFNKWYYLDELDMFGPEKFIAFDRYSGSNESSYR